jgi:uncharacterized protein (TIGR02145 family)
VSQFLTGFHLIQPFQDQWHLNILTCRTNPVDELRDYLYPDPAPKLKMPGLRSIAGNANNVTGFFGLPDGHKTNTNTFNEIYDYEQWWSAASKSTAEARRVYFSNGTTIGSENPSKAYMQSVRLLREN